MAVFATGGHGGNHLPHIPAGPAYLGAGGGADSDTPWAPGRPRRPDLPGGADAGSAPAPSRREAYGIKSIRKRVVGMAPGKGRYRPSALRSIVFYHSITRPIICNRVKQLPAPWLWQRAFYKAASLGHRLMLRIFFYSPATREFVMRKQEKTAREFDSRAV